MHVSAVKTHVDFGLDKHSASISFLIVEAIFFSYLRCFVSHLVRPSYLTLVRPLVATGAGYRSNLGRTLVLQQIEEHVDIGYCNRFIHIGRPIFSVKPSGASVYNSDKLVQATLGFYHIIHTSHGEILYANIGQLPK